MEILTSVKRLYIRFKSLVNDFVYSFGRAALLLLVEVQNHTVPVWKRRRIRVKVGCISQMSWGLDFRNILETLASRKLNLLLNTNLVNLPQVIIKKVYRLACFFEIRLPDVLKKEITQTARYYFLFCYFPFFFLENIYRNPPETVSNLLP